jgi:hypothetical protein
MRLEVFTEMNIQVKVFFVMTICFDVVRYVRFGGPCCRHLQEEDLGALIFYHTTTLCHNSEDHDIYSSQIAATNCI